MTEAITPAQKIIAAFGGPSKMAREIDEAVSVVSYWKNRSRYGLIPHTHAQRVLEAAVRLGLGIGPVDFFWPVPGAPWVSAQPKEMGHVDATT